LCLEDLTVANLIRNKRLARAITDAGWAEFARQLAYKQAWRGGQVMVADRWFPSTKTCSRCGQVKDRMGLAERLFRCDGCGLMTDRDRNGAANLAAWAEAASRAAAQTPDRQAGGRVTKASGGKAPAIALAMVEPTPAKEEPMFTSCGREGRTPEKGAAGPPTGEVLSGGLQWNDSPQAQAPWALGLSIVKPDFSSVSR
jgi:Putative transposase DNA-binding domain